MLTNKKLQAFFLAAATLLLTASCSTTSTRESTALALDNILAGTQRAVENSARDRYRHPKETLLFFGLRPEMRVLEICPERGGNREIIARLAREDGK